MTYLPPEWAPQRAVQLTWPRRDGDFGPWFDEVEQSFLQIARSISQFQPVLIGCADPVGLRSQLLSVGARGDHLQLHAVHSNDVWARDHGPITVRDADGTWRHLDFVFNGWGNKFDASLDNTVSCQLAAQGALTAPLKTLDFVLEGGGIEADGQGSLLTTERCLLAPTRNPTLDRAGIEAVLRAELGVDRILWLRHGDLLGDDTDGHIDTIARFCNPSTIAYQACDDASDPHFDDLKAMEAELKALRQPSGAPYSLVPLPLPKAIYAEDGRRLPAGYPNFLILNGAVLVPTYHSPATDAAALAALVPCFPGRQVIGVDCSALIRQYGSLHCVTMQIPA